MGSPRFLLPEAQGENEPVAAVCNEPSAENEKQPQSRKVGETPCDENRAHHELKHRRAGTNAATGFDQICRGCRKLNVAINEPDEGLSVLLAVPTTGQPLAEIDRAPSAQTFAAGLAATDRFFVLVIKTTHNLAGMLNLPKIAAHRRQASGPEMQTEQDSRSPVKPPAWPHHLARSLPIIITTAAEEMAPTRNGPPTPSTAQAEYSDAPAPSQTGDQYKQSEATNGTTTAGTQIHLPRRLQHHKPVSNAEAKATMATLEPRDSDSNRFLMASTAHQPPRTCGVQHSTNTPSRGQVACGYWPFSS